MVAGYYLQAKRSRHMRFTPGTCAVDSQHWNFADLDTALQKPDNMLKSYLWASHK